MAFEDIKKKMEEHKAKIMQLHKEHWENLKPFQEPDDVPLLPDVSKEEFDAYYVPKLIQAGAIPIDKLVIGKTYIGNCRNTDEAMWNGKVFEYERYKFGSYFTDKINHFQEDDGYDLFVPIKEKEE